MMCFSRRGRPAKRLNNKGLSLVEIVVVMAIIAIASAIVWMSVNTIFGLEAKKAAKDLYGAIEKVKVQQMTKQGNIWLHLYKGDGRVYLDIVDNDVVHDNEFSDGNKIGSNRISVTYTLGNGSSEDMTGTLDGGGIVLAFNRSDGSFKTLGEAWDLQDPGYPLAHPGSYCVAITISSGGFTRTITLYPNTGKIEYSL